MPKNINKSTLTDRLCNLEIVWTRTKADTNYEVQPLFI